VNISSGSLLQFSKGAHRQPDPFLALQESLSYTNLRANTYLALMNTNPVVEKLTKEMGYQVNQNDYVVINIYQTNIFEVLAFADTAMDSAKLANAITKEFISTLNYYESFGKKSQYIVPIDTTVVKFASVPVNPLLPLPKRNILLGIYLGIVIRVLWIAIKRNRAQKIVDVQRFAQISGLRAMGTLPLIERFERSENWESETEINFTKQIEQTRTNLLHKLGNNKSVLITSVKPSEGKTFIAAKLAESITQLGMAVCFVGADFRGNSSKKLIERSNLDSYVDLSELLIGAIGTDQLSRNQNNVTYVLSPNIIAEPNELLFDFKFKEFMSELGKKFDVVIVDSPALAGSTDANLLASITDSTIILTRYNYVKPNELENGLKSLARVNVAPIGFIFNMLANDINQVWHSPAVNFLGSFKLRTHFVDVVVDGG
jgi:capsular exopolysaccharide synthesis family protein